MASGRMALGDAKSGLDVDPTLRPDSRLAFWHPGRQTRWGHRTKGIIFAAEHSNIPHTHENTRPTCRCLKVGVGLRYSTWYNSLFCSYGANICRDLNISVNLFRLGTWWPNSSQTITLIVRRTKSRFVRSQGRLCNRRITCWNQNKAQRVNHELWGLSFLHSQEGHLVSFG